ncbi:MULTISPECIES: site-specific integrase [unclassified Mesorhizobium]|uniref:tyrosine-type recombinase/integrase n=1 Tax=unclassified Mesorhizobium TaxID=325217 RepID=UPI0016759945|nr:MULTISPECIES: site-specific integrase [unclassified Mesorhizobium]
MTDAKIKGLSKPGVYADGAGLYIRVHPGGSKSWFFIYRRKGIRREIGLGGLAGTAPVTLAIARRKADDMRDMLANDRDPFAARQAAKTTPTFAKVAEQLIEAKRKEWTPKTEQEWRVHLLEHASKLGNLAVDIVGTEIIESTLLPIWKKTPATGQRVRGKIESVLDFAIAKKLRTGDNPARWSGHLEHILSAAKRTTDANHEALPYAEVAKFLSVLGGTPEERCLRFTVLTACRSASAIEAHWDEIDLATKTWTIPTPRTKTKVKPHIVPLSDAAIAVLGEAGTGFVFKGAREGRPIGNSRMREVMAEKRPGVTVHGFRSTFRDWAGEETNYPREIAEWALEHLVGNDVERAYRRGDALEKRRALMADWANYCGKLTRQ